jgi:hypothetical protein
MNGSKSIFVSVPRARRAVSAKADRHLLDDARFTPRANRTGARVVFLLQGANRSEKSVPPRTRAPTSVPHPKPRLTCTGGDLAKSMPAEETLILQANFEAVAAGGGLAAVVIFSTRIKRFAHAIAGSLELSCPVSMCPA